VSTTGENDSDEILTDHRLPSCQLEGKNSLLLADRAFGSAHPCVEDSLLERLGRRAAPAFAVEEKFTLSFKGRTWTFHALRGKGTNESKTTSDRFS
jgi:hypothetical protein